MCQPCLGLGLAHLPSLWGRFVLRTGHLRPSARESISSYVYEDIIHTETNLSPDIHTPKLGLNSFNVFRKDRSSVSSAKESRGGVLVAVSNIYRAYEFVSIIGNVEC